MSNFWILIRNCWVNKRHLRLLSQSNENNSLSCINQDINKIDNSRVLIDKISLYSNLKDLLEILQIIDILNNLNKGIITSNNHLKVSISIIYLKSNRLYLIIIDNNRLQIIEILLISISYQMIKDNKDHNRLNKLNKNHNRYNKDNNKLNKDKENHQELIIYSENDFN